jgi:hypothetical protein
LQILVDSSRPRHKFEELEEEFEIPKPARMLHFESNKVLLGVAYKHPSGEWMRRQAKIDRSMFDNNEDLKAAMHKVAHRLIEFRVKYNTEAGGDWPIEDDDEHDDDE